MLYHPPNQVQTCPQLPSGLTSHFSSRTIFTPANRQRLAKGHSRPLSSSFKTYFKWVHLPSSFPRNSHYGSHLTKYYSCHICHHLITTRTHCLSTRPIISMPPRARQSAQANTDYQQLFLNSMFSFKTEPL